MKLAKISLVALLFASIFVLFPPDVLAKDEWLQVRSKNFLVIGNASEKDIRKVATKLEQFRESFRLIFGGSGLTASIPTNVVVFKSNSAYRPFKPKRSDGKIDNFVAGYFQPGEDVNYITLSTEGTDADIYGTIFHEYVHFILDTSFGRSEVPPWFNEGLAEYYQTFEIEEDQKVMLGKLQSDHVLRLRESKLIPLGPFFELSNAALLEQGDHSRSIFYSQAWAMIHYLTFKGKTPGLRKFLALRKSSRPAEEAFREAFGMTYPEMEKELRQYVGQGSFKYMVVPLKEKLTFDADMQTAPLSDAESNAYLGDLLFHVHRVDDSEPYLNTALTLKPDLSMANTTLGMVRLRQRKFDEAKTFLEKAISQDHKNHLALYNYAYLLSREGRDEFGYVRGFESEPAAKMRNALKKAIEINPNFTESYELLAFVNLVSNEELDETLALMTKALAAQPGNMRYLIRMAEIHLRKGSFTDARAIAEKISKTADENDLKSRADRIIQEIRQREEIARMNEETRKRAEAAGYSHSGDQVLIRRKPGEKNPTPEQIAKAEEMARMRGLNQSLRTPEPGEKQILGRITKIDCTKNDTVLYTIKSEAEPLVISSKDFQTLSIVTFVPGSEPEVGCSSDLSKSLAVIAYVPGTAAKGLVRGELRSLEFVPDDFRFIDLDAEPKPPTYVIEETGPPPRTGPDAEERRTAMFQAIRENLKKPAVGEKREMGFIDRSECTNKGIFVYLKVGENILKLTNSSPQTIFIRGFTPDIENLVLGCGMKQVDIPVVFVYRDSVDTKAKTVGDLLSLEFVPKSFTLE